MTNSAFGRTITDLDHIRLYKLLQRQGVIPGIKEFIAEFTSEKAVGDEGYLSGKGLVPLPAAQRKQAAADANSLKTLAP